MSPDLSLLALILNASLLVQGVLLLLLLASLVSWTMIFDRARALGQARREIQAFEARFWSGGDLGEIEREIAAEVEEPTGMRGIFSAGFREFMHLREHDERDTPTLIQSSERAMRVAFSRELDRLERHLALLATIGSTSPYIGLFGTVWGIMQAFHALGNVEQATLALVAPGISEALVATAFGLFAAIPAVIAYNRYADQVDRLGNRYEEFIAEFSALLQRQGRG